MEFNKLWNHFADAVGGDVDPDGKRIQILSSIPPTTSDVPDLSSSDVAARVFFRNSTLYKDFIVTRIKALIEVARDPNKTPTEVKDAFEQVVSFGPIIQELLWEAQVAQTLLAQHIPIKTRLHYVLEEPDKSDMLRKYDTKTVLAVAVDMVSENPNVSKFSIKDLLRAAQEISQEEEEEEK